MRISFGVLAAAFSLLAGVAQAAEIRVFATGAEVAGLLPDTYQLVSSYAAALTKRGATNEAAKAFYAAVTGAKGKQAFAGQGFEVAK